MQTLLHPYSFLVTCVKTYPRVFISNDSASTTMPSLIVVIVNKDQGLITFQHSPRLSKCHQVFQCYLIGLEYFSKLQT